MYTRKQVRFPRSKKKRIRNKWKKDTNNYIDYQIGNGIDFSIEVEK